MYVKKSATLKIVDTDAYAKLNNLAGSALRIDELQLCYVMKII